MNAFKLALLLAPAALAQPSLYILGDSTAALQGWGAPFAAYFDPSKVTVVNAAKAGRSSRTFIAEGWLDRVVEKLHPGDLVLIQFGANDGSLQGIGEETEEIENQATGKHEAAHTYGWYLRKVINDVRSKGATPIVLTAPGISSEWAEEVASSMNVPVLDVHSMVANREGAGALAELTVAGLKALHRPGFDELLSWKGKDVPAAEPKYIFRNAGKPR